MQQRLALAQALIMQPKVLLLDEPFGALDPGIRADIHVLMKRLWHETELTVVMVTHDMREAFTLATRVVAFERPRDRPEERERYGATHQPATSPSGRRAAPASLRISDRPDRDDPVASHGPSPGRPGVQSVKEIHGHARRTSAEQIAANRARYEEHQTQGPGVRAQGAARHRARCPAPPIAADGHHPSGDHPRRLVLVDRC